jgi:hypothetical protein
MMPNQNKAMVLLDSPSRCDICSLVTSLPPSLRGFQFDVRPKPEERRKFLGGGYEKESLEPAAQALIARVLAFLFFSIPL